jgi:hypothetical protein
MEKLIESRFRQPIRKAFLMKSSEKISSEKLSKDMPLLA